VGTGYFDAVAQAVSGGCSSTTALDGSTETAQFGGHAA
jgi:isocitrate lyase